jgi:hypothetical protein
MKMVAEYLEHALSFERMAAADESQLRDRAGKRRCIEAPLVKLERKPLNEEGQLAIAGGATERACTTVTLFAAIRFQGSP